MLERVWRKRTPLHSWWECKLVQLLWRTVQKFLKKTECRATIWSNNPTPGHTVREKYGSKRYMYLNVHGFPDSSVGKYSAWGDPGSILELGQSAGEGRGYPLLYSWASLVAQLVKNPPAMRETWVHIHGLGRSPGEGKVYPLHYSCLKNSMDCIVHGATKSRTRLSDFHFPFPQCTAALSTIGKTWKQPKYPSTGE